jgi:hypothetical protein
VNAEPSYEMLFDRTPAEVTRLIFWVCWANGVKGYTYGANGIWQLNRKDQPYGNSPWGGGYGKIAWDEATNLPGSAQAGLAKKLLSAYPWQKFEPHPSWAQWTDKPLANVPLGDWIWFPEGDPAIDAPVGARQFRRGFDLPADGRVKQAALAVAADDRCAVWLNGVKLGSHETWRTLHHFDDIAARLKPGRNVLAIGAENVRSNVARNPAGLICGMSIELEDGRRIDVASDATWRAAKDEPAGWRQPKFDDATWPAAKSIAPSGGGPWGKIGTGAGLDRYLTPHSFGIARTVRFVYVPFPRGVTLNDLEPDTRYTAFYFDPVDGKRTEIGEVPPGARGVHQIKPPATDHDWLLVLEARK